MNSDDRSLNRLDYIYKLFVIGALVITVTILANDIVVPIFISAIIAIVLMPLVKKLERKLSPVFSILIALLATAFVFTLAMLLIINQLSSLVMDLPNLETRFSTFIDHLSDSLTNYLGMSIREQNQLLKDGLTSLSGYATGLLATTTNIISLIVQVPIYIFLFLIYRDRFQEFVRSFLSQDGAQNWEKEIAGVVQGYISGLMLVTLIVAALNSIGLLILGIDHAIFFGVLSGLLTIIPYIGIFIGATFPVIMALLTKDSIWYSVGVVIIFSIVQFLEGNFITPRITGSKVSINALAAIIALLVGGKILGIAGMILAVPVLGVIKIMLAHTTRLKRFVVLIDDSPLEKPQVENPETINP
jgi:putative heme transporter